MGTYLKGILGSFSGKVGTVIGSSWNGIDYMRSLSRPSSKPPTLAQLAQRIKFGLVTSFAGPIRSLLDVGFKQSAVNQTGSNAATSYMLDKAIIGSYPGFMLDYSKVLISKGSLTGALNGVAAAGAGSVILTWDDNSLTGNAQTTDQSMVLVYNPAKSQYVFNMAGPDRDQEIYTIPVPANFAGDEVEVWMAFISEDKKSTSTSIYAGSVTIL